MGVQLPNKLLKYEPLISWSHDAAAAKLTTLYNEVLRLADGTITWYHIYRSRKGKWSKALRLIAIILLIFSTLLPYFAALKSDKTPLLYTGYIFAGIGGGLLLLDRYYGYSNSWVRFVLTGIDLENMRNAFVENWQVIYLNSLPLTKESFAALINSILKFQESFNGAVKAETEAWAKEFQQSFKDLSDALKSQTESLKNDLNSQRSQQPANGNSQSTPIVIDASEVTPQILEKAVRENSDEWSKQFGGPFESIGVARKIKGTNITNQFCIQFDVKEKKDATELKNQIPVSIPYNYNGKTYLLPTDVVPVGQTKLTTYVPIDPENYLTGSFTTPRQPGVGCGRRDIRTTGTIGMLVQLRSNTSKKYLLSCFHVLCSAELAEGKFTVDSKPEFPDIISPSKYDDDPINPQQYVIGRVEKGLLYEGDETHRAVDAAIAEVIDGHIIPEIYNTHTAPKSGIYIDFFHAEAAYPVRMFGRSSAYQEGNIVSHFTNMPVDYPTRDNPNYSKTMRGVIKTTKICVEGDSGALVYDSQYRAIGLAFASNDVFSYIIPYQPIFSQLNLDFL